MKLLVTGGNGQLGHELRRSLAPLGQLTISTRDGQLDDGAPSRVALDLTRPDTLTGALDAVRPDIVVNAAAYTAVDRAETEPQRAHRVNADAVAELAAWCRRHNALLLHYSTDYIFAGNATRPWREDDSPHPASVYGASKLAGEQAIRASGCSHLLLRTAWVYAAHGHNFLRTMLRLGRERDRLAVVDDQHGTPTSAALIARVTGLMLRARSPDPQAVPSATYHLTNSGDTTWYGFARTIMAEAHAAGLLPEIPRVDPIASADYPTPAPRPAYSVLNTTRLRSHFDVELPDWRESLRQVIAAIAAAPG